MSPLGLADPVRVGLAPLLVPVRTGVARAACVSARCAAGAVIVLASTKARFAAALARLILVLSARAAAAQCPAREMLVFATGAVLACGLPQFILVFAGSAGRAKAL